MNLAIRRLADDNRARALIRSLCRDADINLACHIDVHNRLEPATGYVMRQGSNPVWTAAFGSEEQISRANRLFPPFDSVVPNLQHIDLDRILRGNLQMNRRVQGAPIQGHADGDRGVDVAGGAGLRDRVSAKTEENS